jgi:hypothetical protein
VVLSVVNVQVMSVKVLGLCLLFFFTLLIRMRDFLFTEKKKKKDCVVSCDLLASWFGSLLS